MKKLIAMLFCLVLAFAFVACAQTANVPATSSVASSNASASSSGSTSADGNADRQHTLVWAVPATPNGMDHEIHYSMQAMEAEMNVYDSLLGFKMVEDPNGSGFLMPDFTQLVGNLAESWEWSEDNKTITVYLKKGVKSHDGNEMTADDWMYKHERGFGLDQCVKNFADFHTGIFDLNQIKKIDEYTISITTKTENPITDIMLSHLAQHMIDSKKIKEQVSEKDPYASTWMATNAAGYGPYKLVEYNAGDQLVFQKHQDYWDKENPAYFEKVIMKEIPQSANRVSMLRSGDIDAATNLTASELKELENAKGVKVYHFTGNLITSVRFNNNNEILKNTKVRQALCWAAPYKDILDTVYMGTAKQATGPIPSIYPGYKNHFNYTTDYEKAKTLLKEAGYPDGFKMKITVQTGVPQHEQIAIQMQTALKNIGVNLEIEKMQTGDYYNKVAKHGFDGMFVFEDSPGTPDGGFAIGLWCNYPSTQNIGDYNNSRVNELYKATAETRDTAARMQAMDELQKILVEDDPIWINIAEPGFHIAVRDDIQGLQWNTLQQIGWKYLHRVSK
jgi:peptide/nickel transport system substrate-binding protein